MYATIVSYIAQPKQEEKCKKGGGKLDKAKARPKKGETNKDKLSKDNNPNNGEKPPLMHF